MIRKWVFHDNMIHENMNTSSPLRLQPQAPMFDERHFPYEYECDGCSASVTVKHEDVQDVPSYLRTRTVAEAVEYVITSRREWSIESRGALCPDCASSEPAT